MTRKTLLPSLATSVLTGWTALQGLAATAEPLPPEPAQGVTAGQGLTEASTLRRLALEARAQALEPALRDALGEDFAGAWLDAQGTQLLVGVTSEAGEALVRRAGAEPRRVARSQAQLERVMEALNTHAREAPPSIHAWYVDVPTNSVVVLAQDAHLPRAQAFLARSQGAADGALRIVPSSEAPRPVYDVRGGDPFFAGSARCTVGFSVQGGFVTAGHCAPAGATVTGYNGVVMGVVQASVFPSRDYAWVKTNASWTPQPWVRNGSGGNTVVAGSTAAAVGASVCRHGNTTGWMCGTIQARNVTVNYAEGAVTGLTRTNVCSEPGDSGGPWLSGSQAQGMTSGGSGNCTSGGTTYFQPVNAVLAAYGLTLKTGSTP
ncbi:S1 family peptidase [Stigmatella erecta]|uniref:Streptogrisin C n=1 Tax=Stigmatella erecta TaxID=83460 RepID=A0A1I0HM12_9BACT|nr:S1 family peptidase [Stigmatella erecta]SET85085.1 streptogrisin C [Stigmatella erecta]